MPFLPPAFVAANLLPLWDASSSPECSKLESLSVCGPLGGEGHAESYMIDLLISNVRLQDLKTLRLSESKTVTDKSAVAIAKTFPKLQDLDLRATGVTGVGVKALVKGLVDLKTVNISSCGDVGEDAVSWARAQGVNIIYGMENPLLTRYNVDYV